MHTEQVEQKNFRHLVLDIFWFGLALPATTRFLAVYAIRVDASPQEIGWLSAMPSLVLFFAAMFSTWWRHRFPSADRAVLWPGFGFRFSFLLPAFTPLFPRDIQPIWLIFSIALPAFPQGISSVMFLAMLREAISTDRITQLVSKRHLVMNMALAVSTLAMGFWLTSVAFPLNYQMMFVMAFALTMISQWHVSRTRSVFVEQLQPRQERSGARPWQDKRFQQVIAIAFVSHFAFFVAFPLIPVYLVDNMNADEQFMSFFILGELVGGIVVASVLPRVTKRIGHRPLIAPAMVGTAFSTLLIALAPELWMTLFGALLNGAAWSTVGIALFGFFTENTPNDQVTPYTLLYNQIIFVAMFIAPLVGTNLTDSLSMVSILLGGAFLRLLAAAYIQYQPLRYYLPKRRRDIYLKL